MVMQNRVCGIWKKAVQIVFLALVLTCVFSGMSNAEEGNAEASATETISSEQAQVSQYALIAAAIAFGVGALGAGYAIAHVGSAAMGAVAEKPEIAGQALIFIALAEGLVVFGFITALMILGKA
jgi:V/A-type H+-transporting ATPase subunit K